MSTVEVPDLASWIAGARTWLAEHADQSLQADKWEPPEWGVGSDDVSVFHSLSHDEERRLLDQAMAWQQLKFDAGYGAITWSAEYGGAGLPEDYARAFEREEANFKTPQGHETLSVTVGLVAPTIHEWGTAAQRARFVTRFLRAEELCCQLFSEPGAGSDLAGLATRAQLEDDQWVINGQKVWSSGAQFASWGQLIARTDPNAPKHGGMTAFMIPMDNSGVEVKPIRQMTGGTSFNEVFLTDVRVPDGLRLGNEGDGWRVALTTLGLERSTSGTGIAGDIGGSWPQVLALARWLGRTHDPVIRRQLAKLYVHERLRELNAVRWTTDDSGPVASGARGSMGKLLWTQGMTRISEIVSELLGPRLVADTKEWGTYAWSQHVLGAPGYRIAGGTDEIQRNIIAERLLDLPRGPRWDRDVPFADLPRGLS